MSSVYFYLPRCNSISTPLSEFLARWNVYSQSLRVLSGPASSITLLIDETAPIESIENLTLKKLKKNRLLQFIQLVASVRHDGGKTTLIAGNNYDALLIVLIVRKLKPYVKVQASLHAEIDSILAVVGLKARFKRLLLGILLPRVDSLRLVRFQEIEKAMKQFGLMKSQIVVCPVPVKLPEVSNNSNRNTVGYLGRIHSERSPFTWSEIALAVSELKPNITFSIAGSGPDEREMRKLMSPLGSRAQFLGYLTGSELEKFWSSIGTLLLTAPFESYGLAAREALLRGVRVVAPRLDTYVELERVAPSFVKLFSNKEEAIAQIANNFEDVVNSEEVLAFRTLFETSQNQTLNSLATSWT